MKHRKWNGRPVLAALVAMLVLSGSTGLVLSGASTRQIPDRVDKALERAMRANPDVLLAEARVHEAEAHLNAVKLRVAQELTEIYAERRLQVERVERMERKQAPSAKLVETGRLAQGELEHVEIRMAEANQALSTLNARIHYLIGGDGRGASSRSSGPRLVSVTKRPRIPDDWRESLQNERREIDFDDATFDEVVAFLESIGDKVSVVANDEISYATEGMTVTADADTMSIWALLHLLSDRFQVALIVRDYGLHVVTLGAAERIDRPAIPEDLPVKVYATR